VLGRPNPKSETIRDYNLKAVYIWGVDGNLSGGRLSGYNGLMSELLMCINL